MIVDAAEAGLIQINKATDLLIKLSGKIYKSLTASDQMRLTPAFNSRD